MLSLVGAASRFGTATTIALILCFAGSTVVICDDMKESEDWEASTYAGSRAADLVPLDIWTIPANPVGNRSAMVYTQVSNIGLKTVSDPFVNTLYVDGSIVATQQLDRLRAGEVGPEFSATVLLNAGSHTIMCFADSGSAIKESRESNNVLWEVVPWAAGPDLIVTSLDAIQNGTSTTNISSGLQFDVSVTIMNVGDAKADCESILRLSDVYESTETVLGTETIGFVEPGESVLTTFSGLSFIELGNRILKATVDATDVVWETNDPTGSTTGTAEVNNELELDVQVKLEWLVMGYIAFEGMYEWLYPHETYKWSTCVNHSDTVRVILLIDRFQNWEDSNDSNTRIYELADNNYTLISDLGELNVGDPSTLSDFIVWAAATYPAQKRLLWMFDHGNNWQGSCDDEMLVQEDPDIYSSDQLNSTELKSALSLACSHIGSKIDVLAWYACMMGNFEVAYQVKDYVKVMAGCEGEDGLPVYVTIRSLIENPMYNASELGARLIYDDSRRVFGPDWMLMPGIEMEESAAIELARLEELTAPLEIFSQYMLDYADSYRAEIVSCRSEIMSFGDYNDVIDLYHFVELIEQSDMPKDQTLADAIQHIKLGIENSVISLFHTEDYIDTHGMTIYLPFEFLYHRDYDKLDISQNEAAPTWPWFLKRFCGYYAPPYVPYGNAQEYCGSTCDGSGIFECLIMNDYQPQANLTTGDAGLLMMVRTGGLIPPYNNSGAGEAIYTGYAGFRGIEFSQAYDETIMLSCSWSGNYIGTVIADVGAEASFMISVHVEIRNRGSDWIIPGGSKEVVVDSCTVTDGDGAQLTESFSVTVELSASLTRDVSYVIVTYVKAEVRAVSTEAGGRDGAHASVDLAPDLGSQGEFSRCSCMSLRPVVFRDDFADGDIADWTVLDSGGCVDIDAGVGGEAPPSLKIFKQYVAGGCAAIHSFEPTAGRVIVEAYLMVDTSSYWKWCYFNVYGAGAIQTYFGFVDGYMRYYDGVWHSIGVSYVPWTWYLVRLDVSLWDGTYDIYVNGILRKAGAPLWGDGPHVADSVGFQAGTWNDLYGVTLWVDDVIVVNYH